MTAWEPNDPDGWKAPDESPLDEMNYGPEYWGWKVGEIAPWTYPWRTE